MKFIFESSTIIPSISETLSALVDGARININDIQYNEPQKTVEILMQRKEFLGVKKSFFGHSQPIYSQNTLKMLLSIMDVVEINIKTDPGLLAKVNSTFTAQLGISLKNDEVYISSVEELQGQSFCQVWVKVQKLNIKCVDLEE